jgi:hypothetical protein
VAEVLAPGLELFRIMAKPLPQLRQGSAEGVGIKVGKPGLCEGLLEDPPDRGGGRPMRTPEPCRLELLIVPEGNLGRRKDRIVWAKEHFFLQEGDPVDDDTRNLFAHREEPRCEGL